MRRFRPSISRNVKYFLLSFSLALILFFIGHFLFKLPLQATKTLFLLIFSVSLWATYAIPPFAVSLLIVGFQLFFLSSPDDLKNASALEHYTQSWSSPVIWLLMGGFFLSLSLTSSGLDKKLALIFFKRLGKSSLLLLFGMMFLSWAFSMLLSNTATTALILSILAPALSPDNTSKEQTPLIKSLLVGIPAAASIGGISTLIGSTPNAIAHRFLTEKGIALNFLSWMKIGLPISLMLLLLIWMALVFYHKIWTQDPLTMKIKKEEENISKNSSQQWIVGITFFVTLILWITGPLHFLSVSVVAFIPMIILTLTGIVQSEDIKKLPWDTFLLIMGGISLGDALLQSGLTDIFLKNIQWNHIGPKVLLLLLGYISVLFSNVMSNTAATSILIPLTLPFLQGLEKQGILVVAMSASLATFFPISTPPNAISFSLGYLKPSDFFLTGAILAILGPLVLVFAFLS